MEIGNQNRELRTARGLTQETVAEVLGVSAQALSKWERGQALPDISLLPALSAFFGVTIDALFALTDDKRMERIQNMLYDEREFDPAVVENERRFLLEKGLREPKNAKPYTLLADMENHLAQQHHARAELAAREALNRDPYDRDACGELSTAMGGRNADWYCASHHREILFWMDFVKAHPDASRAYLWLLDQLIDSQRFEEARQYLAEMARHEMSFRVPLYEGNIAWFEGKREEAMAIWQRMCETYPDEWLVHLSMGDVYFRAGAFDQAIAAYETGLAVQKPPKFVDAYESIAQVAERMGDVPRAIRAYEEEIQLLKEQWDTASGEAVDQLRREIVRLKAK